MKHEFDPLATVCGLYCGSCRYYMNDKCRGCGSDDRQDCTLLACAKQKGLRFCSECDDFPCEGLSTTNELHPKWLEDQAKLPPRVWNPIE